MTNSGNVLTRISPGFAAVRVQKNQRVTLLSRLPGWTIAGVVTSGTVGAATTTTSGDGQAEAAATTTGVVETNGTTTTTTTTISGDGREEAAATTGVEVARTMTGVAGNHP